MSPKGFPIKGLDFARIVFEFLGKHFEPLVKEMKKLPLDWSEEKNANNFFMFFSENVDGELPVMSKSTQRMIFAKLTGFVLKYGFPKKDEIITYVPLKTSKSQLLSFAFRELMHQTKPVELTRCSLQ